MCKSNNTRINVIKSQVQDTEHAINEMLQGSSGLEHSYTYTHLCRERYLCWSFFIYDYYYYLSISQCVQTLVYKLTVISLFYNFIYCTKIKLYSFSLCYIDTYTIILTLLNSRFFQDFFIIYFMFNSDFFVVVIV